MLALRNILHKTLAVIVSVAMVCTLTPSAAWAANDVVNDTVALDGANEGSVNNDNKEDYANNSVVNGNDPTRYEETDWEGQEALKAATTVRAYAFDAAFAFSKMSKDVNYENPTTAATELSATPLQAVFGSKADKIGPFNITWSMEEVERKPDGTYATVAGTDKILFGPQSYDSADPGKQPPVNAEQFPLFEYGAFQASDFVQDKIYKVSIKLVTEDETPETATAYTIISINGNYTWMQKDGLNDSSFSIEGNLYQTLLPPVSAELTDTAVAEDAKAYGRLSTEAATHDEGIIKATDLTITNLGSLDPSVPPYLYDLTVRVPIPMDQFADDKKPQAGDIVNVYGYEAASDAVKLYEGTVVAGKDANGVALKDQDGNPIYVAEFTIAGVSTALGTFAVGFPSEGGVYTLKTSASVGGTISPYGLSSGSVETTKEVSITAIAAGYGFKGVEVKIGGEAYTLPTGALHDVSAGSALLTIDPTAFGLKAGSVITVHASFDLVEPAAENYTVTTKLKSADGQNATGDVSFISGAGSGMKTTVQMGQTSSAVTMNAKGGVLFEFNPGSGFIVDTVTVNGAAVPVLGTSYFVSVLTENITVEVTYKQGDPIALSDVTVSASLAGKTDEAYFYDALGSSTPVKTTTYTTSYGNPLSVTAYHPETYMLEKVVAKVVGSNEELNLTAASSTTQDTITLYNLVSNMSVVFTYASHETVLTVGIEGQGGSSPQVGTHALDPGEQLEVTFVPAANFVLGGIKLNGASLPQNTWYDKGDGSYSVTVRKQSDTGSNPTETTDGKKIVYVTANTSTLLAYFDTAVPPAEAYYTVYTSVAATGKGSLTPDQKVAKGASARVYFFPDEGYKLNKVYRTVNGVETDVTADVKSGMYYELTNIASDEYIKASFTNGDPQPPLPGSTYTITPSASAGGFISPAQPTKVFDGQQQTFSFFAATGYQLSGVFVNGQKVTDPSQLAGNAYTFTNVKADQTISVTFAKKDATAESLYALNVSVNGEGGTVSPTGKMMLPVGQAQSIMIMPQAGYAVDKVMVSSGGTEPNNFVSAVEEIKNGSTYVCSRFLYQDIQANTDVVISFKADPSAPGAHDQSLITLDGSKCKVDGGAVLYPSFGGLTFPADNPTAALPHSKYDADFTVVVLPGYQLDLDNLTAKSGGMSVKDDLEIKDNGDGSYSLKVPARHVTGDLELSVVTKQAPASTEKVETWVVTLETVGNGTISPSGTNDMVYVERGKSQTFYFIPADNNNRLKSVEVNGEVIEVTNYQYVIDRISSNTHIKAEFEPGTPVPPVPPKHTITINSPADGHGQISPTGTVEVLEGGNLSVTLIPDAGYQASAKVNGSPVSLNGNTVELKGITGDMTVAPEFTWIAEDKLHSLDVQVGNPAGGTATPLGKTTVMNGGRQTITILPGEIWTVDQVWLTVEGQVPQDVTSNVSITGTAGSGTAGTPDATITYTTPAITGNTIVEVKFRAANPGEVSGKDLKDTHTIKIDVDGSGGIVSPTEFEAADGAQVSVSIVPFDGYKIGAVTVNGSPVAKPDEKGGTLTLTADGPKNVVVSFVKDTVQEIKDYYTVHVTSSQGGSVSPDGLVTAPAGGSMALSFLPDPNYQIEKVEIKKANDTRYADLTAEQITNNNNSYTLMNIDTDLMVHATFVPRTEPGGSSVLTHDIEASSSANGQIAPSGTVTVADGASSIYSFVPQTGYRLSYVMIDGTPLYASAFPSGQYTFTNVKENHTIHAVFVDENAADTRFHTINVNSSGNGTITPSGDVIVEEGKNLEFTIVPFIGFKTSRILLDGQAITPDSNKSGVAGDISYEWNTNGTLTVKGVTRDMNLSAEFTKIELPPGDEVAEYTTIKTICEEAVSSTHACNACGSTSYGPGTVQTAIEKLANGTTLDISVIPEKDHQVQAVTLTVGTNAPRSFTQAELNALQTAGYISLGAADVNQGIVLKVTFEYAQGATLPAYFEIVSSSQGGGSIMPSGRVKVAKNSQPVFNFLPNVQFELSMVTLNGKTATNLSGTATNRALKLDPVTDDQTIVGIFKYIGATEESDVYTVNARQEGGGGYVSTSTMKVPAGESATLYFFPDQGKNVGTVSVQSGTDDPVVRDYSATAFTLAAVTADTEVIVTFRDLRDGETTPQLDPVTIDAKTGAGKGEVTPAQVVVPAGSAFKFYLLPENGWLPDYVDINGERSMLTATADSVTMVAKKTGSNNTLVAAFRDAAEDRGDMTVEAKVEVTVNPSITIDSATYDGSKCAVSPPSRIVPYGAPASFYIFPEKGWTVKEVLANGWSQSFDPVVNLGDSYDIIDGNVITGSGIITKQAYEQVRQNASTQRLAGYDFGATTGYASYRGGAALTQTAGENNTPYYSAYVTTIPSVTGDTTLEVVMVPIQDIEKGEYNWVNTNSRTATINSQGGGTVNPIGQFRLPEGSSMDITVKELTGYFVKSVTINGESAIGRVQNGKLNLTVGKEDLNVLVEFAQIGEGENVQVKIGSIKDKDGNDISGTIKITDGDQYEYKIGADGYLTDSNGNPVYFARGESRVLCFEGKGPNGIKYVVDSATFGGADVPVNDNQDYIELVPKSDGTLDVVLKESEKPDEITTVTTYTFETETKGKGTVTSDGSQVGGKDAVIAITPYEEDPNDPSKEHWITGTVEDYIWVESTTDKSGLINDKDFGENPDGTFHGWMPVTREGVENGVVEPGLYHDGTYTIPGIDAKHKVIVTFVEATYIDVQWDHSQGFIAPNPGPGEDHLKIAKTRSLDFFVGPYILPDRTAYDLKTFTVNGKDQGEDEDDTYLGMTTGATESEATEMLGTIKVENFSDQKGPIGLEKYDPNTSPENAQVRAAAGSSSTAQWGSQPNYGNTYYVAYRTPVKAQKNNLTIVRATFDMKAPDKPKYTITARVMDDSKGRGSVSPLTATVEKGGRQLFTFKPNAGWKVGKISIDGSPAIDYFGNSYTYTNVNHDGEVLQVGFVRDDGSAAGGKNRLVRTLSALAKSGDLTAPVLGTLLTVAVLALGVTWFSHRRRKKQAARPSARP